ncbi:MAG: hypothetical protein STSR0008_23210 [Ignavibacterium sp.]
MNNTYNPKAYGIAIPCPPKADIPMGSGQIFFLTLNKILTNFIQIICLILKNSQFGDKNPLDNILQALGCYAAESFV